MTIGLAFLLAFIASVSATRLVLAWLRRRQILDHPNERSSHSLPTPRGGGLAVTPVVLLGWAGLALAGRSQAGVWPALAGAAALLILSWRDDRHSLPAHLRLAVHMAAAVLGIAGLPADQSVFQGLLPFWLDRAAAVLGWVWFVNLYNFMDGIDGITGVETAAVGLGLTLVDLSTGQAAGAPAAAVAAAAGLGFLVWNWHPAKLFLGDSGSVPLGYLLGWLLLSAAAEGRWAAALILPAYYLADATVTLLRRARRGEKLWQAHRQHFYQLALSGGASHAQVVRLILATDVLLVLLALWANIHPWLATILAAIVVADLLARLGRMGRRPA